jgi:tRNA U34 5-methylaminomethyl-2-thiouridine-forming methyltransferase MnmC
MKEQIKIIETEDGSHSLYVPELNETYHSFHGAWQESMHVFIEKGLRYYRIKKGLPEQVRIFEVGFGTGLNALLSVLFANEHQLKLHYTSIEPFPLEIELVKQLNYGEKANANTLFMELHQAKWGEDVPISPFFTLEKLQLKLEDVKLHNNHIDIVYFDAFAPGKQAELWTPAMLQIAYDLLEKGGILVTYCAQGQFKRNLKEVGFTVESVPGPPGKKEMVRAEK